MVDTHCHLNFHSYKKDYLEIAQAAFDVGVKKIINVGAKLDSSRRAVKIASEIPFCFAAVGVHPHHAEEFPDLNLLEEELIAIIEEDLRTTKKIVAIGECGLDYREYANNNPTVETHHDASLHEENVAIQKNLLKLHFHLAQKYTLPLIIHCRDAYSDLLSLLRTTYYPPASASPHLPANATHQALQAGAMRAGRLRTPGVIHCFQGTIPDLKQFLTLGFYIGYDGYITYAKNYEELVAATPLDRILTETDSPWLTPEPLRGKRNSPANIKIITEKIAKIKKMSFEEIDKATTENAKELFII